MHAKSKSPWLKHQRGILLGNDPKIGVTHYIAPQVVICFVTFGYNGAI
jgi:hypothetical protein